MPSRSCDAGWMPIHSMPQDIATWGFLYLRKGQLDQAVECLLRALEVDPHHKDATDHLVDVLRALIDELVHIGFSDGFLSKTAWWGI